MRNQQFPQLSIFASFTIALGTLLFLAWGIWQISMLSEIGITWSPDTGVIDWIAEPNSLPSVLRPGVQIIRVEGVPVQHAPAILFKAIGETVELIIAADTSESQVITVPLSIPSATTVLSRLEPSIIALAFWILSVIVLAFSDLRIQATLLFFLARLGVQHS